MREATGLRAVLDTNVYLSVFVFPESRVFDLWRLAREGRYTVVISPFILREFMEKLREKFGVPAAAREIVKRRVLRKADIVQPQTVPKVIADDPDDDHILACAVAGEASVIVSGNKHLLRLREYHGIPIVRPMDFLRTLGK
ncbi:MAG TPA: putative toxin-antitoxin system toxin component, PIN family [Candidatus Nanoperiomorbaceae bacterium]|jgi:putative PIN family toxin of toxin-antitoxin system|nr:putative toxin-antitoxin system toxin component, PIN family [Candidatus Nanoperiomorbaceae bacterium]